MIHGGLAEELKYVLDENSEKFDLDVVKTVVSLLELMLENGRLILNSRKKKAKQNKKQNKKRPGRHSLERNLDSRPINFARLHFRSQTVF